MTNSAANEGELGDFVPEDDEGWIAVYDPYKDRLKEVLFGGDKRRICQLFPETLIEPEYGVYIKRPVRGIPVVVSRTLRVRLRSLMYAQIDKRTGPGGDPLGPDELSALLRKITPPIETHVAEIDREAVDIASRACEAVLRRTRAERPPQGLSGVTYHAGQWTGDGQEGRLLSGAVGSPRPGTLASEYIAFGDSLRRYAASEPSQRQALRVDLVAKAEHLLARARGKR